MAGGWGEVDSGGEQLVLVGVLAGTSLQLGVAGPNLLPSDSSVCVRQEYCKKGRPGQCGAHSTSAAWSAYLVCQPRSVCQELGRLQPFIGVVQGPHHHSQSPGTVPHQRSPPLCRETSGLSCVNLYFYVQVLMYKIGLFTIYLKNKFHVVA